MLEIGSDMLTGVVDLAYIGPGVGLSLTGALVGLLGSVGCAFGVILLRPIRAAIRRITGRNRPGESTLDGPAARDET